MGFKLSPEEIEALKKFAQDTPEKQISDMASRPSPYNFDILKSALGQGKFRDTGRESSGVGESLDSMAGAPVRQAIKEAQEGNFDRDAAMRVIARFGADPKNAPTGVDIASKVTSNPYLGAGLATAVDVGAQLPLPVKPGIVGTVASKGDDLKALLKKIDTPEKAVALKGAEREQYLKALDEVYGDRAKRASDLGYSEKTWYHGSPNEVPRLKSGKTLGPKSGNGSSEQIFASDNIDTARIYGKPMNLRIADEDLARHRVRDVNDSLDAAPGEYFSADDIDVSELYKEHGNDRGLRLDNLPSQNAEGDFTGGTESWLMLRDGSRIRREDAAFDPRFKDSDLLLAGMAGAAPNTQGAALTENAKKRLQEWFKK